MILPFLFLTTDVKCTLFAIFEIPQDERLYMREISDMQRSVTDKLAEIPDCTKLLITSRNSASPKLAETLHLSYDPDKDTRDNVMATILEVFHKRWETLDIVAMMKEVKRTVNRNKGRLRKGPPDVLLTDSLSNLPRLQKTEEDQ